MTSRRTVTLGVGGFLGHDGNAALVADGEILFAAQEERYTRKKHDGRFPQSAIDDALATSGLRAEQVTDLAFAEKHLQARLFDLTGRPASVLSRAFAAVLPRRWEVEYLAPARARFPGARVHWAWHHLAHVAGAFYTSDCERAAFLCVDGKGEDYNATLGVVDARRLEIAREIPGENGLGLFYTLVTRYLGFPSFGSEYKVMGLAPYGSPRHVDELRSLATSDADGGFRLRAPVRFFVHEMETAVELVERALGQPRRGRADPVEERHADVAASLQRIFEEELFRQAEQAKRLTGESQLLFTGGCAQNCVAAGKLRASGLFDEVHNSPVAGDMASGLGAALLHQRAIGAVYGARVEDRGFLLGSEPGAAPSEAAPFELPVGDLFEEVAARLAEGKIVAWCRGRMELGARALGARSIFADARVPGMQSRLNRAVKFREGFRPFAPVILEEELGSWFDSDRPSRYMQFVAHLRSERRLAEPDDETISGRSMRERLDAPRAEISSVVHVDHSARIQSVERGTHPDLHRLLTAFRRRTGIPVLINTSFNISGEPIVRTAAEAWRSFEHTDVDLLVIGERLYRNPGRLSREEKMAWVHGFIESS